MAHIMQEFGLLDPHGCSEPKTYKLKKKEKKKNTSGLSMKGKATDKNLELTKNFKRNGLLSCLSSFGSLS